MCKTITIKIQEYHSGSNYDEWPNVPIDHEKFQQFDPPVNYVYAVDETGCHDMTEFVCKPK
jgi:hypothetical protein